MKDARAFSDDGYIIDQRFTGELQYGRYSSDYNGCGWIAAYNLMRALGRDATPEQVNSDMNAILPYHGCRGTPVRTMAEYLGDAGVTLSQTRGVKRSLAAASACRAGIIRYLDEGVPHYVAFVRYEKDNFRFFNAVEGNVRHIMTMRGFFDKHVGHAFACVLTVGRK